MGQINDCKFSVMSGGGTPPELPIAFHAATYDPITFELQQESVGVGGETCTHTSTIYAPDYLGVYHAFGANEPVFEGYRSEGVIGAEMVPGSDFSSPTDSDYWEKKNPGDLTVIEVENGNLKASLTGIGATFTIVLTGGVAVEIGKTYRLSATIYPAGASQAVYMGSTSGAADYLNISNGTSEQTKTVSIEATTDTVHIHLLVWPPGDNLITYWDDISVREVVPTYYADDGAGTLLDPLPMLVYQKATTNHFLNSAAPVTQDVTVVSGQDYTVWVLGAGSITLSGAGTGVATEGSKVTFTASTTTLTCTYAATLTHVQVEDGVVQNGLITTAGTAVSTDEIINTWAAANHSDAGDSYEADYKLSGGDQILLSMGGQETLEIVSGNVVLSDGVNICNTPVVSATPHIIVSFNATDGMTLDVDGVTDTSAYDGTLGSGDLSTQATQRDLIRREA